MFIIRSLIVDPNNNMLLDGSKRQNRVRVAYSIRNTTKACQHENFTSIFTAELEAIFQCLQTIFRQFPDPSIVQNYAIVTDSVSYLQSISSLYSSHPIAQRISFTLYSLSSTHSITSNDLTNYIIRHWHSH